MYKPTDSEKLLHCMQRLNRNIERQRVEIAVLFGILMVFLFLMF